MYIKFHLGKYHMFLFTFFVQFIWKFLVFDLLRENKKKSHLMPTLNESITTTNRDKKLSSHSTHNQYITSPNNCNLFSMHNWTLHPPKPNLMSPKRLLMEMHAMCIMHSGGHVNCQCFSLAKNWWFLLNCIFSNVPWDSGEIPTKKTQIKKRIYRSKRQKYHEM